MTLAQDGLVVASNQVPQFIPRQPAEKLCLGHDAQMPVTTYPGKQSSAVDQRVVDYVALMVGERQLVGNGTAQRSVRRSTSSLFFANQTQCIHSSR